MGGFVFLKKEIKTFPFAAPPAAAENYITSASGTEAAKDFLYMWRAAAGSASSASNTTGGAFTKRMGELSQLIGGLTELEPKHRWGAFQAVGEADFLREGSE